MELLHCLGSTGDGDRLAIPPTAPSETATVGETDLLTDDREYLALIDAEHVRFDAAIGEAAGRLDDPHGDVARLAALQRRLTRQFLDANRAILRARCATRAEVASIEHRAGLESAELVTDALATVAPAASQATDGTPLVGSAPAAPASTGGVDDSEIARLVDDAFSTPDPDGHAVVRALGELLDAWWRSEVQENRAAVDDANARAAVVVHHARVQVDEVVELGRAAEAQPVVDGRPDPVASPVLAALDGVPAEGLDAILASLLDALTAPDVDGDPELDAVPDGSTPDGAASEESEQFSSFWAVTAPVAPASIGHESPAFRLLVPAIGVIAVLALILALLG